MVRCPCLLGIMLAACAASGPPTPPPTVNASDPNTITQLSGYRTRDLVDPVFGGTAHVLEVGPPAAPALLLVHGLGENGARDFYPLLPNLAQTYHVVAVDLPGFGRSTHGTALYSPTNYVRFLHECVRPRMSGSFALIGHSMGGAVSLLYAHRHPEDVTRLVLIDAAGILHREALIPFIAQTGIGKLFEPAQGLVGTLSGILVDHAAGPDLVLENEFTRTHLLSGATQIAAAALIVHDFGPAVAELKTESLILWGRKDAIAPLRTGKLLAARLPNAQLIVLEQSGHTPMETEPDAIAFVLQNWLQAPHSATSVDPAPSARLGRCEQAQGMRFRGAYRQLDIVGCQDVVLENVRAESIRIWDSQVVIEGAQILGSELGLYAARSRVELTGCMLSGQIALRLDAAELDVAGSEFTGQVAALRTKAPSRILFSASHLTSPMQRRYLHEVVDLQTDQSM